MDLYWVSAAGLERREVEDLPAMLARTDGFVWADAPACDDGTERVLSEVFGFHPRAIQDCVERNAVPKCHAYVDHFFLVVLTPELGDSDSVVPVELDQFMGRHYLVTVHGPLDGGVPVDAELRETRVAQERIERGRFRPGSPYELSYSVVSALNRRMEELVRRLAIDLAALEVRVMRGEEHDAQRLVEEMFRLRHRLLRVEMLAVQNQVAYDRIVELPRAVPPEAMEYMNDLRHQFDRVRGLCEGEQRFLQGVIDLYLTRTTTELNLFAKRFTGLGAILVSATLVAGIYGMNFAHMPELDWKYGYPMSLGIMVVIALGLFWWFRRKHWI